MGSHGIKDRVAIIGMGCTRFGEHWDKGVDDLIIAAAAEAFKAAGVTKQDVDAYWFGTAQSGMSGIALARPLGLADKPVTRVEMTFRRLATSDGIHNYFWKARPLRDKARDNARDASGEVKK